jgi:cephalosporin hydroxylase
MHGDLWRYFLTNPGHLIVKLPHYFPIYERHLARFRGGPVTIVEIGVAAGGSLQMWKHYLGAQARVVGLDVNPLCAERVEPQIEVFIGDQADSTFLASVVDRIGPSDVVIDDGSHRQHDVGATFDFLYPRLSEHGVYIVEDLHAAYWPDFGGGLARPGTFIERAKGLIDELNAHHCADLQPSPFTETTNSIHLYDSVAVFEKGPRRVFRALTSWGSDGPPPAED